MNNILKEKDELINKILILKEEFNMAYINYYKSKNNYDKLSKLLYSSPNNIDLKNKFKSARKIKESNEKKYYQLLHKIDIFYKRNRKLVFSLDNNIKYSFLTDELFIDDNLSHTIIIRNTSNFKDYITNLILNNNLDSIEKIENYFNSMNKKLRRV